jgi:hypothetical protein
MMAHLSTLDWDYLRWRAGTFEPQEQVRQALQRLETLQQQMSEM